MDSAKILLVEDDQTIAMGLEFALCQEGYTVTACARISEARQALSSHAFHLAILDINLPDGDGYALCKQIKQASPATSIIFLTVHEEQMSAVMGLELGADDYITKPFRLRELLARVKAVLRRGQSLATNMLQVGPLRLYPDQAKVYRQEEELFLTAMEYRLLLAFMRHPGQVLTRSRLMEALWDVDGAFVEDNTLSVYVRRLREKIGDTDAAQPLIATVRGLGYRMEG